MNGLLVSSSLQPELEKLMRDTIGACIAVHREFGPGLSEVVYSRATCIELDARGIPFEAEKPIPIRYGANWCAGSESTCLSLGVSF